jgi:hypothetical protein
MSCERSSLRYNASYRNYVFYEADFFKDFLLVINGICTIYFVPTFSTQKLSIYVQECACLTLLARQVAECFVITSQKTWMLNNTAVRVSNVTTA